MSHYLRDLQNSASLQYYSEIEMYYSDLITAHEVANRKGRPDSEESSGRGILDMLFLLETSLFVSLGQAMLQGRPWRRVVRVLPPAEYDDVGREEGDEGDAGPNDTGTSTAVVVPRSAAGLREGGLSRQVTMIPPFETIAEGSESGDRSTVAPNGGTNRSSTHSRGEEVDLKASR